MNKKDFLKAMSMIDDDLMRDADATANADDSQYADSVSGVEQYRRPVWQTIATLAASLLLVIGAVTAGTHFLTHRGTPTPDEERIIAASTAETETTSAEEASEVQTTVLTRKRDTLAKTTIKGETRESTDTQPVTDPSENEQPVTDSTDEQPKTDKQASTTTTYQVCNGAPLSTQTTVQTTTIPVWTQFPQTTRIDPNWHPNIDPAEWDYDIFADLAKNSYYSTTCDGIPQYRLVAPDGTEYLINLSEQWVWRRTPDMIGKSVEPEEAMLTPSQWYFLTKRGAEIGMREDIYGW
ncbi:MAG: hypothetical protein IKW87_04495 [Ruminococcus sp.]|nr:hypothetical protein [Ruminococcus sp.]